MKATVLGEFPTGERWRVWLDGEEVTNRCQTVEIDGDFPSGKGQVLLLDHKDGKPYLEAGEVARRWHTGDVRVEPMKPAPPVVREPRPDARVLWYLPADPPHQAEDAWLVATCEDVYLSDTYIDAQFQDAQRFATLDEAIAALRALTTSSVKAIAEEGKD